MADFFRTFGQIILWTIAIAAILGLVGLALVWRKLKQLNIPEEASFVETLQRIPFSVVLVLDLLDLAFDVFASPIVWIVLGRFNLDALRRVTMVEVLIPGTQLIPTLSASWLIVRVFRRAPAEPPTIDAPNVEIASND